MALPSHGHVLPVHCLQSLSRRLSLRGQLHLEGQTLTPEPAGCSPGTLHCQPGNTTTPVTSQTGSRPPAPPCWGVTFRATEASGSRPHGTGGPTVAGSFLQELGICSTLSLEAGRELCSSSASKASAWRDLGWAPQPLAAIPACVPPPKQSCATPEISGAKVALW